MRAKSYSSRLSVAAAIIAIWGFAEPARAQTDKSAQTDAGSGNVAADAVTYEQVRAVFKKHCLACHNDDRERGGLDLSTIAGVKAGGASGPVVVPGSPDESLLYTLAAQVETPKMPPNKPRIPQRELDLIRRWIEVGLAAGTDSAGKPATPVPTKVAAPAVASESVVTRDATGLLPGVPAEPLSRATAITALAVSPRTPLVAISGHRQVVLFHSTDVTKSNDNALFRAFPFPEGDVFALRFSHDGALLLAGGGVGGLSGKVVGFEVATGKRVFELGDEQDVVLALDISADKSLVALGGPGRSVKVFRTATGELAMTLRKHTDWILSLAFSPDGLLLASGDRFGGLQVWEAESGKEFHTLRGHVGPVHALGWSADSERVLSAGQDGSLRFWEMHEGSTVAKWDGNVGGILAVECDAAGRVVCGGRDKTVAVWDKTGSRLQTMSMPDQIVKLGLSHDSAHVVAGDAAGNVAVFALDSGELAGRLQLPSGPRVATKKLTASTKGPSPPATSDSARLQAEVLAADPDVKIALAELETARSAAKSAEAAVKSAEESLSKLQEMAVKLTELVASREAFARQASQRAIERRAKAASAEAAAGGRPDMLAEHEQIQRQLSEKRALLVSAAMVAEKIARAAADSPHDAGLATSAKLATELRNGLSRDVDVAADALHRIEESLRKSGISMATPASR